MRFGKLEVSIVGAGQSLDEEQSTYLTSQWQKCSINLPVQEQSCLKIRLKDDTTKITDYYDLRAEILIMVDGQICHQTKNCVLLQDVSEYEFTCPRQSDIRIPAVLRQEREAYAKYSLSDSSSQALIEIIYRRYHRARNVRRGSASKIGSELGSCLEASGSTLSLPDSTTVNLEAYRFSFDSARVREDQDPPDLVHSRRVCQGRYSRL